jgi:hypothetical protein
MLLAALKKIRCWYWRWRYTPGKTISRFIACDIRRDVEIVDAALIASGVITARTRTWNVLYTIKGLAPQPAFGDIRAIAIADLWKWSGESWGGPVPPSTDKGV